MAWLRSSRAFHRSGVRAQGRVCDPDFPGPGPTRNLTKASSERWLSVVEPIVGSMSFPTSDMIDAFNNYLDTEQVASTILERRLDLESVLKVEDGRPMLRLTLPSGKAIVAARITHNHTTAWTVATPDKPVGAGFGTGSYPGGSIAAWMIDEYDRLMGAAHF